MPTSKPRPGSVSIHARGARIRVLDAFLRPVEGGTGMDELTVDLAPGAYRVTARIGAREETKAVLVREGKPTEQVVLAPAFDAAAPVDFTATANETHGELARDLSAKPPVVGGRLIVILRGLRNRPMASLAAELAAEVAPSVHEGSGNIVTLPRPAEDPHHVRIPEKQNRALGWGLEVHPGPYRVRWSAGPKKYVEHAVWVAHGHQTLLFVPQGPRGPVASGASVHMVPLGKMWDFWTDENVAVEAELAVLRSGTRRARTEVWEPVLTNEAAPPMLILLTLHEMVRSKATLPDRLVGQAVDAMHRLQDFMKECPDVAALVPSLDPGLVIDPVEWPPMLRAAHNLLLAGERAGRDTIAAGSLAERVTGQVYASHPWHLYDPTGLDEGPRHGPTTRGSHRGYGAGHGPAMAGPDEFEAAPGGLEDRSAPVAAEVAPTTVSRVRQLLAMAGDDASEVGADEVAERLGMTTRLAEAALVAAHESD